MGRRKKEAAQMGKALIKDRFRGKKPVRGGESFLHTTDLNDTSDWGTLNLQSVTEQTSLDDFLTTAELAGRDFTAEKENIRLITPDPNSGRLSSDKMKKIQAAQEVHKNLLRIPRRPPWNEFTPADKLKEDEHISFLEWRRQLARLQEEDHIVITPYEKNLEFWRQLWRVIERSDVVVQIVDARNPLLFWCPDLDKYVKEVDPNKQTLLLINKADFLTAQQRQAWADYFRSQGMRAVFWSAMEEAARVKESESDPSSEQPKHLSVEDDNSSDDDDDDLDKSADNDVSKRTDNDANIYISDERHGENADAGGGESTLEVEESESVDDDDDSDNYETVEEYTDDEGNLELVELGIESKENRREQHRESYKYAETEESTVLSQEISTHTQNSDELLELFRKTAKTHYTAGVTTVGMVGYPNVGKSSTINAILQTKKVPVSATPGRTKHFQTLYVDKDLMLCDCPGLVFPSFVNTKAELVVNGILSIDQLMDSESPVALVCERIGRTAFEGVYHINLPAPEKGEDCKKPPNAYDVLHAYGLLRGFMSHKGNPDRPRAARYILKDFVNGKLLFCHPPPGIDPLVFQQSPYAEPKVYKIPSKANQQKSTTEVKSEALDKEFFAQIRVKAHAQGPHAVGNYVRTEGLKQIGSSQGESDTSGSQASVVGKPWKRHNNHNKKEKLRRIYAEHDCH